VILDGVSTIDHTEGEELWDADEVTDRAISYLESIGRNSPYATWVHYLDPHEPRKKMAPYDFGDSDSDLYDTEVAFSDREVGRLLEWLSQTGRLEDTLVVLVSDHGEAFQDHGVDLHGNRPFDDQIFVPLMMWAPDIQPSRVGVPVGVLDIAPSVLSYLGAEQIPASEGIDILMQTPSQRPIFTETPLNLVEVSFFAFAVTDGSWRYIYDVRGNTTELYDLSNDPGEVHNMADRNPQKAAELRAVLSNWLDTTRSVRSLRELSRQARESRS
jgi:arylsulfatase A-like enzyme